MDTVQKTDRSPAYLIIFKAPRCGEHHWRLAFGESHRNSTVDDLIADGCQLVSCLDDQGPPGEEQHERLLARARAAARTMDITIQDVESRAHRPG